MMIDVRVLGGLEILNPTDETVESIQSHHKRAALLVYLAVAAPAAFVRRATLLGLFWPDRDESRAKASLKQELYQLRQSLGRDVIVSRGEEEVGVNRSRVTLDAWTFEDRAASDDLEAAAQAYGGSFLSGFFLAGCGEFDHWVETERDRLDRVYRRVLEGLVTTALESETPSNAVTWARRLGARDPYSTRTALRVMEVLEVVGDRAGALQYADAHANLLRQELDAEPSPDVTAFADRLRKRPLGRAGTVEASRPAATLPDQHRRIKDALVERYRVEREVGAGGMATVYLAEDIRHHRKVAVKVLRPELTAALGSQRFLNEIRLTANLQHPNIVPLLDSGETGGLLYYVMPFVEGESLRERLRRETQLPIPEAVRIAITIGKALDYSHRNQVVHRDIKPENILLHDGEALVSDFGIALAVSTVGQERITETGLSLGTPEYMSPEQISGERSVDARTDVYSLGVVLHEMLAGEPPFTGATTQAIAGKILTEPPTPLRRVRETVPEFLEGAVLKALAKRPVDRFASATEFTASFETKPDHLAAPYSFDPSSSRGKGRSRIARLAGTVVGLGLLILAALSIRSYLTPDLIRERVVVQPFENRTIDSTLDQIAWIVTHHVQQALWQSGTIQVMPLASVQTVSERVRAGATSMADPGVQEVARRMGAGMAVTGFYYFDNDTLRFRSEIHDVSENRIIATVGPLSDEQRATGVPLQALGGQIAGVLSRAVNPAFASVADQPIHAHTLEAYEAFEAAHAAARRGDSWRRVKEHAYEAVRLDSAFHEAIIYAGVAHMNLRELELADSVLGVASRYRDVLNQFQVNWLDWARAEVNGDRLTAYNAARRAAEIAPGADQKTLWGFEALKLNKPREAARILEPLYKLPDMGVLWYYNIVTRAYHQLGDHRRELRAARRGRTQYPNERQTLNYEIRALAARGDIDEIEDRLAELSSFPGSPNPMQFRLNATLELRAHGHLEAADSMILRALAWYDELPEGDEARDRPPRFGILLAAGRFDEAQALMDRTFPDDDVPMFVAFQKGWLAAKRKDVDTAERTIESLMLMVGGWDNGEPSMRIAQIASALGDKPRALQYLRDAFARDYNYNLRWGLHSAMYLEDLWDDDEFVRLYEPRG